jgi:hypothetical protein
MHSEVDTALAVRLAADWLRSCPDLLAAAEEEMIDRLLHSPRRGDLCAIGDIRRGQLADEGRSRNWDAIQVLVDFEPASARLGEAIEPKLLWHIRARGGDRRIDGRSSIKMSPRQLTWMIAAFRQTWPACHRPSGSTWGDDNPWDASEYLFSLISRLGDDTSDEAIVAIEALRAAPPDGYTEYIRTVTAEQRRKRVEKEYMPPKLRQVMSILNAGPPTDAADLQAVTVEALQTAQRLLRGSDVDWYRGFFRENGGHRDEESCRDELIKMLRSVDHSLQYIPETHVADDKRVDIVVQAHPQLILPIEIKGQWHSEIWTAADKQLDHLYVNDWRAERGIYLILWLGVGTSMLNPPNGSPKPTTALELHDALSATSKAAFAGRVEIVVLDLTRPS